MNPERRHNPGLDAQRTPDNEAAKALDSVGGDETATTSRMEAPKKQTASERKAAETEALRQQVIEAGRANGRRAAEKAKAKKAKEAAEKAEMDKDTADALKMLEETSKESLEAQDRARRIAEIQAEAAADREAAAKADLAAATDEEIDAAVEALQPMPTAEEARRAEDMRKVAEEGERMRKHFDKEAGGKAEVGEAVELTNEEMEAVAADEVEEAFFAEGDKMDKAADKGEAAHAKTVGEMGYVERGGNLVRGEARNADVNEASNEVDRLKSELEAARSAYAMMPWYKRMFAGGNVKKLEEALSKAEDKLAEAKHALDNPKQYHKAKTIQGENRSNVAR